MLKLSAITTTILISTSSILYAGEFDEPKEAAGNLISQIAKLDGQTFKGTGILKMAFMQFDEDNPTYKLMIGNRKYSAKLDDGRGTSQRAKSCEKEEFIGLNPNKGCPISFEAEYNIETSDGGASVELVIWNVDFQ